MTVEIPGVGAVRISAHAIQRFCERSSRCRDPRQARQCLADFLRRSLPVALYRGRTSNRVHFRPAHRWFGGWALLIEGGVLVTVFRVTREQMIPDDPGPATANRVAA